MGSERRTEESLDEGTPKAGTTAVMQEEPKEASSELDAQEEPREVLVETEMHEVSAMDPGRELPPELVFKTPFPRPRMGALRNILATVAVGIVVAGLVWFSHGGGGFGASEAINLTASASGPAPRIDKEAPDFSVRGLDGEYFKLSDFRGQPVWISFWATWCPPCRAENPDIEEVYEDKKDEGLVILALSIGEDAGTVRGYVERTGLTFKIGLDQNTAIAANYRIVGIPTHYFVDADGILQEFRIGSMSKKTMEKNVNKIMSPSVEEEGQ